MNKLTERIFEINKRKAELREAIENNTVENLEEVETELRGLDTEIQGIEKRMKMLDTITIDKPKDGNMESNNYDAGSVEYRSAYLKKLMGQSLNESETRAYNVVGTAGAIPTATADKIFATMAKVAPMLNEITLMQVAGNVKFAIEGTRNAATKHTENTAITPAADAIVTVELGGYEYIKIISISESVSTMTIDSFENWLANILAEDIAVAIEDAIINGTGSSQPKGVAKAVTWDETNSVDYADGITFANITAAIGLLPARFDNGAKFLMNKKMFWNQIANITDSEGNPIAVKNFVDGAGTMILGYPLLISDKVADGEIYLGNYKQVVGNLSSLLKLDPSNTDLLVQKQELLTKALESTGDKLATLKDAQAEVNQQFAENKISEEQYRAFTREIAATEAKIKEFAKAADDNNDVLNGVGKEFEKAGDGAKDFSDDVKKSASDTEESSGKFEKLGSVMGTVGKAFVAGMATIGAAAGVATIKLGKEVVQQFGELEQNLGGSEAVFQDYADRMQKIGEDAYKNMGVSQSQYLATANVMGALFQGSGVEVEKSAGLTEKAMQRAADMASVMGIDMQMALDSVAGAAKGNFTMMDNLGVAMNATNIEAYALAKGLDFTWKTATQAEKAEVAMQMFFENTEQYAGNFARESTETVSGAMGLLEASLSSFTAGLGNADADMTNLTQNVVDAFSAVVQNVVPILENIVTALPTALDAILSAVGELLPMLIETVTNLFSQVLETILKLLPELIPAAVDAMMTIVTALIDNLPLLIDAAVELVTALVNGIGDSLPQLIPTAVDAVVTIVEGLLNNLPLILDAALQLILGLTEGLLNALPQLISELPAIILGIVDFIIESIPQIIEAGIQLFISLVEALPEIIKAIVEAIPQIIDGLINAMVDSLPLMIDAGIDLLIAIIDDLPYIIDTIVKAIPEIINSLVSAIVGNIDKIIDAGVQLLIAMVANQAKIIFEILKIVPEIIKSIVDALIGHVGKMKEVGTNLIKGLWQGISDAGEWLWNKISGFFGGVVDRIKDFFGIASPSKLFEDEIGVNLALGVGEGFENTMNQVSTKMRKALPTGDILGMGDRSSNTSNYNNNYNYRYDNMINLTVNGNIDKNALPPLETILKKAADYTAKQLNDPMKRKGLGSSAITLSI
ncbi:MAG: phage major capsid protein [Oscillospiraceae bacterium]|nr:phage major capsid protein [Oscillospiraceae bacterium]